MSYNLVNKKRRFNTEFTSQWTTKEEYQENFKLYNSYLGSKDIKTQEEIQNILLIQLQKLATNHNAQITLVGKRGVGKTTIVKQFLNLAAARIQSSHFPNIYSSQEDIFYDLCYMDFKKIPMSPEGFAKEYISQLTYQCVVEQKTKNFFSKEMFSLAGQRNVYESVSFQNLINYNLQDSLKQPILRIQNEFEKITPNQEKIIKDALSYPEIITKELHKKIIIVIENIDELHQLENYKSLKNIFPLFEKHSENILFITTSTKEAKIKEKLPTYQIHEITGMTRKAIEEYILQNNNQIKNKKSKEFINNHLIELSSIILSYTKGNPFRVKEMIEHYFDTVDIYNEQTEKYSAEIKKEIFKIKNINEIEEFIESIIPLQHKQDQQNQKETIDQLLLVLIIGNTLYTYENSKSYQLFSQELEEKLNDARGKTLLSLILKELAISKEEEQKFRLSAIARKIYRSAPVTKNLLVRLQEVDLITFKNNHYFIKDSGLATWLQFYYTQFSREENLVSHYNNIIKTISTSKKKNHQSEYYIVSLICKETLSIAKEILKE